MALSGMSSREKTVVAILGVVIILALVGIGILLARLLADSSSSAPEGISVTETAVAAVQPQATVTLVDAPSLEGLGEPAPVAAGAEPVVVKRVESVGPLAPVMIASQPLSAGHRYRLEVTASDESTVPIHGSWSQSATSASGQVAAPQIEFFESSTPYRVDIEAPVADPSMWGVSISAGPQGLGGQANLVITVWDVTGSQ